MTRVRVGRHLQVNLSRRSLCDTCIADVCTKMRDDRVLDCDDYSPPFLVLKRCACCGELFEVYRNISALDPEKCPRCNELVIVR